MSEAEFKAIEAKGNFELLRKEYAESRGIWVGHKGKAVADADSIVLRRAYCDPFWGTNEEVLTVTHTDGGGTRVIMLPESQNQQEVDCVVRDVEYKWVVEWLARQDADTYHVGPTHIFRLLQEEFSSKGYDLSESNWYQVKITINELKRAVALGDDLTCVDLSGADLSEFDLSLSGVILDAADFREANLVEADLREARMIEANLRKANLEGANMVGVNLEQADLTEANLQDADLSQANLCSANLTGAILRGANLTEADLTGAVLDNADLEGANLEGADLGDTIPEETVCVFR